MSEVNAGVLTHRLSDHQPYYVFLNIWKGYPSSLNDTYYCVRLKSDGAYETFKSDFENTDFSYIIDNDDDSDPNISYNLLNDRLNNCFVKNFPLIKKKLRKKYMKKQPWMTDGLLKSIKRRDKLFSKVKRFRGTAMFDLKFQQLKNFNRILKRSIKRAKFLYYHNEFEKYKSNVQRTWRLINNILTKSSSAEFPDYFFDDKANIITDSSMIAQKFNQFFSTIGESMANQIGTSKRTFLDFLQNNYADSTFHFKVASENDIIKAFSKLKSKSSSGFDGISSKLLKLIKPLLIPVILKIFNQSIKTKVFPDKMKVAKVVPVFKKGDPSQFNNYRPISLLPVISKIFERVLHDQIYDYVEQNQLLFHNQFGYRKVHSTELACASLVEKVLEALDRGSNCISIFMDLSKAFDTIDHSILLQKLKLNFGFSSDAISLVDSYLRDREQYVEFKGFKSQTSKINVGVPQGSILGPLFFIMYINDISRVSDLFDYFLYADDTTLTFCPDPSADCNTTSLLINDELSKINDWFIANKLSLNISKTNFIVFHPPRTPSLFPKLHINGMNINRVFSVKFLGLILNEVLNWKNHIDMLKVKISRAVGVMRQLKDIVPSSTLLTIYHSLVACHFNNNLLIWGNDSDALFKLQKKAVRILSNEHFLAHTTPIFCRLNILKLSDLYSLQLLKFYYKFENRCLPNSLQSLRIRKNSSFHSYNTRSHDKFSIPVHKHHFYHKSLVYTIVSFSNDLTPMIKSKIFTHSLDSLVLRFKASVISSYCQCCSNKNCYSCSRSKLGRGHCRSSLVGSYT